METANTRYFGTDVKDAVGLFEVNVQGMADVFKSLGWEDDLSRLLSGLPFEEGRYFAFLQDPGQLTERTLRANSVTRSLEAHSADIDGLVWEFVQSYMQASPGRIVLINSPAHEGDPAAVEIPGVPDVLIRTNDGTPACVSYVIDHPIDTFTLWEVLRRAPSWTPCVVLANPSLKDLPRPKEVLPVTLVERIVGHTDYVMTDILDNATRLIWERPGLPDEDSLLTRMLKTRNAGTGEGQNG
jgi:hypothetical protein